MIRNGTLLTTLANSKRNVLPNCGSQAPASKRCDAVRSLRGRMPGVAEGTPGSADSETFLLAFLDFLEPVSTRNFHRVKAKITIPTLTQRSLFQRKIPSSGSTFVFRSATVQ